MTLTSFSRTEPRTFLAKAQTGQDWKEGLIAASANSRLARGGTRATSIVISIIITGPRGRRQYDFTSTSHQEEYQSAVRLPNHFVAAAAGQGIRRSHRPFCRLPANRKQPHLYQITPHLYVPSPLRDSAPRNRVETGSMTSSFLLTFNHRAARRHQWENKDFAKQ